jgi:hypothetical protein
MERERASSSLHEQLLTAVERAAHAQEESSALIEQQHALTAVLRDTVARIHRVSGARARLPPGVRKRTTGCP